jgi:hypothetical protein
MIPKAKNHPSKKTTPVGTPGHDNWKEMATSQFGWCTPRERRKSLQQNVKKVAKACK